MRQQKKKPIKHYADAAQMGNTQNNNKNPLQRKQNTATQMCPAIDL